MSSLDQKRNRLLDVLQGYGSCAVAFSAGVDSTVLAKAAGLALGDKAVAVTGVSPSLAADELAESRKLAELIGIRHETIATEELGNEQYQQNGPDRCYHCKTELYTRIADLAPRLGVAVIVNGANLDDLGDYRPGLQAGVEQQRSQPAGGMRVHQRRTAAASGRVGVADLGQAGCALPGQPDRLRRRGYGRTAADDRTSRELSSRTGVAFPPREVPSRGSGSDRGAVVGARSPGRGREAGSVGRRGSKRSVSRL